MTQIVSLATLYDLHSTIFQRHRVVLVTGVFDLLHPEHKKLLQAAKKQGNILLVGLEPDQRVAKLKGPTRPLNPINTRLQNLSALCLADYVFKLPTNLNTREGREDLITKLHPHLLAVSSHTPHLTEKRRIMKLIGGQVKVVLRHNPDVSTTRLIKQKLQTAPSF